MSAGHRWLEHTADLALEVWAHDEPALLHEAARAVVGALTEGIDLGASEEAVRDVDLHGLDPEDRLVQWLNEVLFLATTEGLVYERASLSLHPPGGLNGQVTGRMAGPGAVRAEIKSATYHALSLRHEAGRVVAHVILDV